MRMTTVGAKATNLMVFDFLLRKTVMMAQIKAQMGKTMAKKIPRRINVAGGADAKNGHNSFIPHDLGIERRYIA